MNSLDPHVALFRRVALSLPEAVESSHMGHPDFRLNGHIFATLSAQEKGCGVVKLTSEQQQTFVAEQSQAFSPVQGGWGRMGNTFVHLREADETLISGALYTAYHNLQKKQSDKKSSRSATPAKPTRRRLQ